MSTSGYVEGIDYAHGYYRELNPALLAFTALNRRQDAHYGENLRYLELGFGQGESLAIHAAACPGEFWGTDFNPAHAANAQELVRASDSSARIFDLSFAELAAYPNLPEFDVITMHGIWSWVSAENRAILVDLIRRKLAPGGLLYLSYNTSPGWAATIPLRELMIQHSEQAVPANTDIVGKIDGALAFAQRLMDAGAFFYQANPEAAERLKSLHGKDRHYLAHEYFNRDWQPMPYAQVAAILADAGMNFVGSADLLDHIDSVMLPPEGLALLNDIDHPVLRESARDFMINQQFRKDLFIKGERSLPAQERDRHYLAQSFILPMPLENVPMQCRGPVGELTLQPTAFQPLLTILAEQAHAPKSVAEILAHPLWAGRPLPALHLALTVLTGAGYVAPAQPAEAAKARKPYCDALNAHLYTRAEQGRPVAFLASPVTGGGVSVGHKQQLFLQAIRQGLREPRQWAMHAQGSLATQEQPETAEGKAPTTPEGSLATLTKIAHTFASKALPILQALAIV